jgi:hypothetical protein
VFDGKATVESPTGATTVKAKHEAVVSDAGAPQRFDLDDRDGFDNWNWRRMRRVSRMTRAGTLRRRGRGRPTIALPDASERGAPRLGGR